MRYALQVRLPLLLAVLLVSGACDNGDTPTTPTDPPTVTESFTGTVSRNGSQTHSFVASAAGTVTATLSAVSPADSPVIGFSMGTWDGVVCTAVLTNNAATTTSVLTGTVVGISSLCVRLFDSTGEVPANAAVNYTITVERP